jgi:predicted flavoprotein YhiN
MKARDLVIIGGGAGGAGGLVVASVAGQLGLRVCMANCNSSCNRKLEQTAAMLFPRVAV